VRRRSSSAETAARFHALRDGKPLPAEPPAPRRQAPVEAAPCPPFRHDGKPLTAAQIDALRVGAVRDRDPFFARVCERADRGELDAINACKAAIYGL